MAELPDLPVEWNVIFVFLQEHFGQHGGTGQIFVNRRRWKRSNDYAAFTFLGKTQVVFQSIFGTESPLHTACPVQIPAYVYVPLRSVCNGPNPPGRVQSPLQLPAVPPEVRGYAGIPSSFHRALLLKKPLLSSSRMFSFCPVAGTGSNRESWLGSRAASFSLLRPKS